MQCSRCGQALQSGWRLCPVCKGRTVNGPVSASMGVPFQFAVTLCGGAIGFIFGDLLGAVIGLLVGVLAVILVNNGSSDP